jgi:hypothetical protein
VLEDLRAAAPGLNTLAQNLPAFNEASEASLSELGEAAVVGRRALRNGDDEIEDFRAAGRDAPQAASKLARLLIDLDDRDRAVEPDPRSPTGRGFTGFENLINYVYYQAGAINQYDEIGHLLHFALYEPNGPCSPYNTGFEGVPGAGGGMTRNPAKRHPCVSWTGPTQPGINVDDQLPPYDPSVCPEGSTQPEICSPAGRSSESAGEAALEPAEPRAKDEEHPAAPSLGGAPPPPIAPPEAPVPPAASGLEDFLGIPEHRPPGPAKPPAGPESIQSLLDFLLGD